MKRIQQQAIEHYDRMIAWAETMPARDNHDGIKMFQAIRECTGSSWCSYCIRYKDCKECELQGKYPTSSECCNRLHNKMCDAQTWKQWIERAKKVREYIRENG